MSSSLERRIQKLERSTRLASEGTRVFQMVSVAWDSICYWSLYEEELQEKHRGHVTPFENLKTANLHALEDLKVRDPEAYSWLLENRDVQDILKDRFLCAHRNRGIYPVYLMKKSVRDVFLP